MPQLKLIQSQSERVINDQKPITTKTMPRGKKGKFKKNSMETHGISSLGLDDTTLQI